MEPTSSVQVSNPFVGPQPLRRGQPIYARQVEIDQLYYMLLAQRIVLFYSPSGAGKSSLLYAGLIPRLNDEFEAWDPVRVNLAPEKDCTTGVNRFVRSCNLGWEYTLDASKRRPDLELSAMDLADYVASRPRQNESGNLVLIFDQFEEVLTADPLAIDARQAFFRQLGALLRDSSIWAVITLREDYLAAFDPYAELVPTHLRNRFRLDLFSREAAAEAIAGIAKSGGRTFAPDALDHFVTDLAQARIQQPDGSFVSQTGPYVEPLQLQVAGRRLWDQLPTGQIVIEEAQIAAFGDVGAALAEYYAGEAAKAAAGDERAERAIREWCGNQLIASGNIRGQVVRGEGKTGGLENDLVEDLVQSHLVRGEQRLGATWYELAHDRLIQPVQQSNADWFGDHLSPLQKAAALWRDQHQDGLLFLGKQLVEAESWAAKNDTILEDFERDFLKASQARQRASNQKKRNARLLQIATVAAIAFAIWAYQESRTANRTMAASAAAGVPVMLGRDNGQAVAVAALAFALRKDPQSIDALGQMTSLLTRRSWWLPAARIDYATVSKNPFWDSYALSPDGQTLAVGELGDVTLWDVPQGRLIWTIPLRFVSNPRPGLAIGEEPMRLQFSPDGTLLLVLRAPFYQRPGWTNDALQVWNLQARAPLGVFHANQGSLNSEPSASGPGRITLTRFSPDGSLVATVEDRTIGPATGGTSAHHSLISLWNPCTGQIVGQPIVVDGSVAAIDFSPDSRRLLVAANDALITKDQYGNQVVQQLEANPFWIRMWDTATAQPIGQRIAEGGPVTVAKFDPSGKFILAASGYSYEMHDAATGRRVGEPFAGIGPDYPGTDAAISTDGSRIVTNPAGQVWSWNSGTSVVTRQYSLLTDADRALSSGFMDGTIENAVLTADGQTVVTRSVVNGVQTWNGSGKLSAQDLPVGTLPGAASSLFQFGFSRAAGELFTGEEGTLMRVWRLSSSRLSGKKLTLPGTVMDMVARGGEPRFLCIKDGSLLVADGSGKIIGQPIRAGQNLTVRLSPDASRVISSPQTSDASRRFTLWDVSTGQRVGSDPLVVASEGPIFDPYGPWVVFIDGGKVRTYDERSGASLGVVQVPGEMYSGGGDPVRFSPNGRAAVISYIDPDSQRESSLVWDLQSAEQGKTPIFAAVDFTTDDNWIMVESDQNTGLDSQSSVLQLDRLSSDGLSTVYKPTWFDEFPRIGKLLGKPTSQSGVRMRFPGGLLIHRTSHDGRLLLAVGVSASGVEVLKMRTGEPATASIIPGGIVRDAQFSPDDRIILTEVQSADGNLAVQLWSTTTGTSISDSIPLPAPAGSTEPQFSFSSDDRDLLVFNPDTGSVETFPVMPNSDRAGIRLLAEFAETVAGYRFNPRSQSAEHIAAEEQYKDMRELRQRFHIPVDSDLFQAIMDRIFEQTSQ